MIAGRSEILDLLRGWQTDGLLVRVEGRFDTFCFSSRCRIDRISTDEIRLLADDANSELVFRFTPAMQFGYADKRQVPDPTPIHHCIVIFPNGVPDQGEPDSIALGIEDP